MSAFFKLNTNDLIRGLIVAILTGVVGYIGDLTTLTAFDFAAILQVSIVAGVGYLVKNLLTNGNGQFLGLGSGIYHQ